MISRSRPCARLEAARLGAHLEHADRRGIVDEHLRFGERAQGVRQAAVILLVEMPGPEPMRVDSRLGRQHAHEQLLFRHLEAEKPDDHGGGRTDVLRHVQHQAGLPHRRTSGDDNQVPALEAGRHVVEIREAARHAGDRPLVLLQLLDGRETGLHQVAQRHEAGADPVFGDRENGGFRLVQQQVRFLLRLVGLDQDLVGGVDQAPERGLFLDDPGVVLDVGRARNSVRERGHVCRPADVVQLPRA